MKYVIEIPSKADFVTAYYMEDGLPVMYKSDRIDDLEPYTEPDRKDIEDEVWEFIDFFTGMSPEERYECFDKVFSHMIVRTMSYREAKAKYEAWLKQKDEIHVGDEVETESGNKACVLYENPDGTQMFVFKVDGTAAWWSKCAIHKTGKNHPEVAELLEKMRGDKGC